MDAQARIAAVPPLGLPWQVATLCELVVRLGRIMLFAARVLVGVGLRVWL